MIISGGGQDGETIPPVEIRHGLDAMLTPEGDAFEFHYNYLIYTFRHNGEEVFAKHYMDQPGEVSLMKSATLPLSGFMHGVLLYLALRYAKISMLTNEGYLPLPNEISRVVSESAMRFLKAGL